MEGLLVAGEVAGTSSVNYSGILDQGTEPINAPIGSCDELETQPGVDPPHDPERQDEHLQTRKVYAENYRHCLLSFRLDYCNSQHIAKQEPSRPSTTDEKTVFLHINTNLDIGFMPPLTLLYFFINC